MVKSPYCFVVLGGVKVTETLQLFPGASVLMHWLLTANGAAVVSPVIDMWILDLVELLFVIVTDSALLTLPTLVFLPNFKDLLRHPAARVKTRFRPRASCALHRR
jgi:hypothetical protein